MFSLNEKANIAVIIHETAPRLVEINKNPDKKTIEQAANEARILKIINEWNKRICEEMSTYYKDISKSNVIDSKQKKVAKAQLALINQLASFVHIDESLILLKIYNNYKNNPSNIEYMEDFLQKISKPEYINLIKKEHDKSRYALYVVFLSIAMFLAAATCLLLLLGTGSIGVITAEAFLFYGALSLTCVAFFVLSPTAWQSLNTIFNHVGFELVQATPKNATESTQVNKEWTISKTSEKTSSWFDFCGIFNHKTNAEPQSLDILKGCHAKANSDEATSTSKSSLM